MKTIIMKIIVWPNFLNIIMLAAILNFVIQIGRYFTTYMIF